MRIEGHTHPPLVDIRHLKPGDVFLWENRRRAGVVMRHDGSDTCVFWFDDHTTTFLEGEDPVEHCPNARLVLGP